MQQVKGRKKYEANYWFKIFSGKTVFRKEVKRVEKENSVKQNYIMSVNGTVLAEKR